MKGLQVPSAFVVGLIVCLELQWGLTVNMALVRNGLGLRLASETSDRQPNRIIFFSYRDKLCAASLRRQSLSDY